MLKTEYKGGSITVSMPQKGIFHIKTSKNGVYGEPLLTKYGIIDNSDKTDIYKSTDNDEYAEITDDTYKLLVAKKTETLRFEGSKRSVFLDINENDEGFKIRIPITAEERLFGLGDESRDSVMKRGKKAVMWNVNVVSYGCIPFLVSSEGWGILMNCTYKHTYDLGKEKADEILIESQKGDVDFYIFLANSMKEIIGLYTDVSGKPIMLPRAAYGVNYINNDEEGARELLENCHGFRKEDIPCDIMGLEPGWMSVHYDYSTKKNWHPERFYRPYWLDDRNNSEWTFFYNLRQMGYKYTLWLCCDYDLFYHEEDYVPEAVENYAMEGADILDDHFAGNAVVMDKITIPTEPWFEHLKKFVDQGAIGFKMDAAMQVMEHPDRKWCGKYDDAEIHNLYPVILAKQMQQGYEEYTGKRTMTYTPCLYTGTQKYVATWAGDTGGGADSLVYVMNMAMCGHTNASCDMATETIEGIHSGFLMPWSEILSWRRWHQPWFLGKEREENIRYYAKLRSSLFPYIYSMSHKAAKTGLAIARPLSLMYEDMPEYDLIKNEYMFGDSMLVASFDMNITLPEGKWYDWFTGDVYNGNSKFNYQVPEGKGGALMMKEGSVIVTQPSKDYLDAEDSGIYTINVFAGGSCEFDLIEDDGESFDYRNGGYGVTQITLSDIENGFKLCIAKRTVPNGMDIELPTLTDFEVRVLASDEPEMILANKRKVDFYYNNAEKVIIFNIEKDMRCESDVICEVFYR